jgi:hypothetical protein
LNGIVEANGQGHADETGISGESIRAQDLLLILEHTCQLAKAFEIHPKDRLELQDLHSLDLCGLNHVIPPSDDAGEQGTATMPSPSALRRSIFHWCLLRSQKARERVVLPKSVVEPENRTNGRQDILEESSEQIVQSMGCERQSETSVEQCSGT